MTNIASIYYHIDNNRRGAIDSSIDRSLIVSIASIRITAAAVIRLIMRVGRASEKEKERTTFF